MAKRSRTKMRPSKDREVFKHTASKGKAINVMPFNGRGGKYL